MKSFSKTRPNAALENVPVWEPPELDLDGAPSFPLDAHKSVILSIFEDPEKKPSKPRRSTLHPADGAKAYAAWRPDSADPQAGDMDFQEWDFVVIPGHEVYPAGRKTAQPKPVRPPEPPAPEKEALAILENARLQAQEIILQAQTRADEIFIKSLAEIEQYKESGRQQGRSEARREMQDAVKAVLAAGGEVETWKTNLSAQGEQILAAMLKKIARRMFGEGFELDRQALQANLNRIMESAHALGNLNLFLNPADASILDPVWADQQMLVSGGQIKIIPSANIARGGCYIKGSMGMVDARVETQLEALLRAFDEPDAAEA